jgi:hypothetical protein
MSNNDEVYHEITELIAQLHRMLRTASPDEETLERLREAGALLRNESAAHRTANAAHRGRAGRTDSNESRGRATELRDGEPAYGPGLVSTEERPSLYEQVARHAGGHVYILTSLMNAFNRPEALRSFVAWENLELRLYLDDPARGAESLEYAPAGSALTSSGPTSRTSK